MGDRCNAPVFEDTRLSQAFEGRSAETFEDVVSDYNARHDVWGWKRPSALNELDGLAAKLRNPYFVFVFRDIFSIANRNALSMGQDLKKGLRMAISDYSTLVEFACSMTQPALMVSSDKVVRNREAFIAALSAFCGLDPTSTQVESAISFIEPDSKAYLMKSRAGRHIGAVDVQYVRQGLLRGWARARAHAEPVQVDVEVNGRTVIRSAADLLREDLIRAGVHQTGHCGFEFSLKSLNLRAGDRLDVRVTGAAFPLNIDPVEIGEVDDEYDSGKRV